MIESASLDADARPSATLLTTRRFNSNVLALQTACAELGCRLLPSRALEPHSVVVFQWSCDLPVERRAIRDLCALRGVEFVNPKVLGRWSQHGQFRKAGLPSPQSASVATLEDARTAALRLGYPVLLEPLYGKLWRRFFLAENEASLLENWRPFHRIVQKWDESMDRVCRVLVVDDEAVHAVRRTRRGPFTRQGRRRVQLDLEPRRLSRRLEALAREACRALGLGVGGVDLIETARGPMILEVEHRSLSLTNRALHGPDAVAQVARYLSRLVSQAAPMPFRSNRPRRRVQIVTGLSGASTARAVGELCQESGVEVETGPLTDIDADALFLWGLTPGHYRAASARARAVGIPAVNGRAHSLWEQRGRLYQSGIAVPRSRLAGNLDRGVRLAGVLGYPVLIRPDGDPQEHLPQLACNARQLEAAWEQGRAHLIEEVRWALHCLLRVWVVNNTPVRAERRWLHDFGEYCRGPQDRAWQPARWTPSQAEIAVQSCRALEVDFGIVELLSEPDGETVLRVLHRTVAAGKLPQDLAGKIHRELARMLCRLARSDHPAPQRAEPLESPHDKDFRVGLARSYARRGSGWRIWNIYSLYRELLRREHPILEMQGRFDPLLLEQVDLVLQDPLHAFGFRTGSDRLNRLLYRHMRRRCHLLRAFPNRRPDKRAMFRLARRLGIRSPLLLGARIVSVDRLPVLVKPRHGSQGRGVQLVRTMSALRRLARRDNIIQEFVDSGTGYAVSARVITVADQVVTAALFYHRGALCSNLTRGGRVVALTGPGRLARLTPEETVLLERIGIDPSNRRLPEQVRRMAARVGEHYRRRGVQMLGQDFVVDNRQNWYFLEVNKAFGTAVFNVTDGEGFPSTSRGAAHAGRVLAPAFVKIFSRAASSRS